ncbi:hypothetical protein NC651_003871 [Populus alba x Populus x berolinensis]|nr:hypothetical protein NC651_003871 [Populus alba x Populus x berolinensis]
MEMQNINISQESGNSRSYSPDDSIIVPSSTRVILISHVKCHILQKSKQRKKQETEHHVSLFDHAAKVQRYYQFCELT